MSHLPSGTVTFLFTDIEGSTTRWEAHPTQMRAALARHDAILRCAIESNGGFVFKTVGDAFCTSFSSPYDALSAVLDLQRALNKEEWPPETGPVRVRVALHTGAVDEEGGDYFGQPLNRVARLLSAGHGEQILVSMATQELVRDSLPPTVQLVDMGHHRLKDLTRPEHIFQLQAAGLRTEFPPLRTLDNRPNNLPEQLTPLIGREKEVKAVSAMLHDSDVRLVTLTGPGGIGKTRVALQVAAELLDEYPDGTWFVDLSPVTDSALVVPRVAQALGVREAGGTPLIETLKNYLKDKHLLLLLDNFEHLLEASGTVTGILRSAACVGVKALVTSRVKPNMYGEHEYEVPPLSVPEAHDGRMPPLEKLNQYEAVRLFIERAEAVKADFQVTNDTAPDVAEICVSLDGLPLAIELAAARVRMLPPHALLAHLSERFKLLTGGSRDLPARHRTLRKAIEWSYDLLAEGEQQLFTRMAVFNGGRTLEALEEICNYDGQLQIDVLDGVQSLIDESLLQEREGRDGQPRYWMLETIHEYAREKMRESGERDALRRTHANYFLKLAQEAEPNLRGPEQQQWLDRLDDEHDNLRAALQWAKESNNEEDVEAGLHSVSALHWFWVLRGYYTEGRGYLHDLLERAGQSQDLSKESQARALNVESNLAVRQGDASTAKELSEEALRLARETGDKAAIANALNNLGAAEQDPAKARALHEECLALRLELGDKFGMAASLNNLGIAAMVEGDYARTRELYEESLAIANELNDKASICGMLYNLAGLAGMQGDSTRTRLLIEECIAIAREIDNREALGACLDVMGDLAVEEGDYERARTLYEESLTIARQIGVKSDITEALVGTGTVAFFQGDYALAAARYEEVSSLVREMGDMARAHLFSGLAARQRGELETARSQFEKALALFVEGHSSKGTYETLAVLGEVSVATDQVRRGVVVLGAADEGMNRLGGAMCPPCRLPFERARESARAQLGEEEFEKAWQEGQAMSMKQAVEYARADVAPQPSKEARVKALLTASSLARVDGDVSASEPLAQEALRLAREIGDKAMIADALNRLGSTNWSLWNFNDARALYEESLAIRRELGDRQGVASSLMHIGIIEGDASTARALIEESIAIWRELGNKALVAWNIFNLACVFHDHGDVGQARALLEESLGMCEELGDKDSACNARIMLAGIAVEEGDYERAHSMHEESLATARELGFSNDIHQAITGLANLASVQGEYAVAARLYEEAAVLLRESGDNARSLQFRGIAANHRGEYEEARTLLEQTLGIFVDGGFTHGIAETLGELGQTFLGMGQASRGVMLLGAAEASMKALGRLCSRYCTIPFALVSEKTIAAARAQLGEDEFERAWQEGQATSMEAAVEYARSKAVQSHGTAISKEIRAKALNAESKLAMMQGDIPTAQTLAEETLRFARETGDKANITNALNTLGGITLGLWNPVEARALQEESLAISRELGDKSHIAGSLMNLGLVAANEGDFKRAQVLHEESLDIWRELGDKAMVTWTNFNLGAGPFEQGDLKRARAVYEECLAAFKEQGDRDSICLTMIVLGDLALAERDYAKARALYEESLPMAREIGAKSYIAQIHISMGNLASVQGDSAASATYFQEVASLEKEMGNEPRSVYFAAIAANHWGDYEKARTLLEQTLALHAGTGYKRGVAEALAELGETFVGMGQVRKGVVLLSSVDALMRGYGTLCRICSISYEQSHERARASARAQLGEEEFQKAWQEGQAMSMEQAVECARSNQAVGVG